MRSTQREILLRGSARSFAATLVLGSALSWMGSIPEAWAVQTYCYKFDSSGKRQIGFKAPGYEIPWDIYTGTKVQVCRKAKSCAYYDFTANEYFYMVKEKTQDIAHKTNRSKSPLSGLAYPGTQVTENLAGFEGTCLYPTDPLLTQAKSPVKTSAAPTTPAGGTGNLTPPPDPNLSTGADNSSGEQDYRFKVAGVGSFDSPKFDLGSPKIDLFNGQSAYCTSSALSRCYTGDNCNLLSTSGCQAIQVEKKDHGQPDNAYQNYGVATKEDLSHMNANNTTGLSNRPSVAATTPDGTTSTSSTSTPSTTTTDTDAAARAATMRAAANGRDPSDAGGSLSYKEYTTKVSGGDSDCAVSDDVGGRYACKAGKQSITGGKDTLVGTAVVGVAAAGALGQAAIAAATGGGGGAQAVMQAAGDAQSKGAVVQYGLAGVNVAAAAWQAAQAMKYRDNTNTAKKGGPTVVNKDAYYNGLTPAGKLEANKKLAIEQGAVAKAAMTGALKNAGMAAAHVAAAKLMQKAANENKDTAAQMGNTGPTISIQSGTDDGTGGGGGSGITDGTNPNQLAETSDDGQENTPAPLLPPPSIDSPNNGPVGAIPEKGARRELANTSTGTGTGYSPSGSTQNAGKDGEGGGPEGAHNVAAITSKDNAYDAVAKAGGSGGKGGSAVDKAPDFSGLLAQFLPKSEEDCAKLPASDPCHQQGTVDLSGANRGLASVPDGIDRDPRKSLFKMIEEGHVGAIKSGRI